MRLDKTLVDRGIAPTRMQSQALIAQGCVYVNGQSVCKQSFEIDDAANINVILPKGPNYVSRGGHKLAAALDTFAVDVADQHCLDLGASTGGFTDCLLQRGASYVTAVDVGHGQMVRHLAEDPRVVLREGMNARDLGPLDLVGAPFPFVSVDLSFISLTLVLPSIAMLLSSGGSAIVLVKPQFEVGISGLGKRGIVRDSELRISAVDRVRNAALQVGLSERGRMESPVTGGDGNIEYLLLLRLQDRE